MRRLLGILAGLMLAVPLCADVTGQLVPPGGTIITQLASPPAIGGTTPAAVFTTHATSQPTTTPTADAGNIGYTAAQGAVPMILQSSGTLTPGTSAQLTLTTALPAAICTSALGGCYMYFPLNTLAVSNTANFYYVIMSSTTAGTIYTTTYSSGTPTVPASPTGFNVTTASYTQTTGAALTALTISIPGNAMGVNGSLEGFAASMTPNNANNKVISIKYGGSALTTLTATSATTDNQTYVRATNTGIAASQLAMKWGTAATSSNFVTAGNNGTTVNSASAQNAAITLQLATATDYIVLEQYYVRVFPN